MSQPTDPLPDTASEAAAAAERHAWFLREVHPHGAQLEAWLRGTFPSVRDADDVVQESYIRIWRARATHPIDSAKAFLFKVARHIVLDLLRKGKNFPVDSGYGLDSLRVLDTAPTAAQALLTKDLCAHLAAALLAIPARYRNVLILHKLQGLSHREVAARLNLSEITSQKYCSIGLDLCAQQLKARGISGFSD